MTGLPTVAADVKSDMAPGDHPHASTIVCIRIPVEITLSAAHMFGGPQ